MQYLLSFLRIDMNELVIIFYLQEGLAEAKGGAGT